MCPGASELWACPAGFFCPQPYELKTCDVGTYCSVGSFRTGALDIMLDSGGALTELDDPDESQILTQEPPKAVAHLNERAKAEDECGPEREEIQC